MNSSIVSILELLNKAQNLSSVGFSAGYNFNEKKATNYFDELIREANIDAPIFAGIIIVEKAERENEFTIVDGLQRLTTMSLLLAALCESAKNTTSKNEEARHKIFTRYLINDTDVKLSLCAEEQSIYKKIVFSLPLNEAEAKSNLAQAYRLFFGKIKEQKISATKLFNIISKVQFMIVFTERSQFSARELYQSLNAQKNDLSQINLITSFVSQNCELSLELWQKAVSSYKNQGLMSVFKEFIRDFLAVQSNGVAPSEKALYSAFKAYFYKISQYQPTNKTIEGVYKYSQYYLKILQADFEDFEIQKQIIFINEQSGQEAYPYLMEVLDDLENGHIERQIFLDILVTINSLLANRDENSTTDISFASLSNELNKMIALKTYFGHEPSGDEDTIDKISINEIEDAKKFTK